MFFLPAVAVFLAACAHHAAAPAATPSAMPAAGGQTPAFVAHKNANPHINWVQWSDSAFARARTENKLVFIEISSRWSAWHEQLDYSLSSDPAAAGIIEKDYIPVYVDADRRPDIYARYGRRGLPSLSVLNPDGYVLAVASAMTEPELKNLLGTLARNYVKNKAAIDEALKSSFAAQHRGKPPESYPITKLPSISLSAIAGVWDNSYGGIGNGKKFPMPDMLDFLTYVSAHPEFWKGTDPAPLARAVLDGMAAGLYDGSEGGFYRYSDTPDWKSPHKEKLLGLNSELMSAYLAASRQYKNKRYLEIGESCARFLDKYLLDAKAGAFMNSRSAGQGGNPDSKARMNTDRTLFADVNGEAALAFLEAYRTTGDSKYLKTATGALDYIINNLYNEKTGVLHYKGADGSILALSDQVMPGLAAAQAYEATADKKYLDFAVKVAGICEKKFYDPRGFGYYGFWYASRPIGLLGNKKKPQDENARMCELLLALHYLTGRDGYESRARETLLPFIPAIRKYPAWSAPAALAAARICSRTYEFFVTGRESAPGFSELLRKSYMFKCPDRVVVPLDIMIDRRRLDHLGYETGKTPILYVCSENACFPPVRPGESMEKIRALLLKRSREARQEGHGR